MPMFAERRPFFDPRHPIDRGLRAPDPHGVISHDLIHNFHGYVKSLTKEAIKLVEPVLSRNGNSFYKPDEAISWGGVIAISRAGMETNQPFIDQMRSASVHFVLDKVERQLALINEEPIDNDAPWSERKKVSDLIGGFGLSAGPRGRKEELRVEHLAAMADDRREVASQTQKEQRAIDLYAALVTDKHIQPSLLKKLLKQFEAYPYEDKIRVLALAQLQSFMTDVWTTGGYYKKISESLLAEAGKHAMEDVFDPVRRGLATFLFAKRDTYPRSGGRNRVVPDDKLLELSRVVGFGAWQRLVVDRLFNSIDPGSPLGDLLAVYDAYLSKGGVKAADAMPAIAQVQQEIASVMLESADDIITLTLSMPSIQAAEILHGRAQAAAQSPKDKQPRTFPKDRGYQKEAADLLINLVAGIARDKRTMTSVELQDFYWLLNPPV